MKKKNSIITFLLGLIVVSALLLQSFHGVHHLEELVSEKQCHHKYNQHKTEVSHGHHQFENCFVCEFTFSNFITTSNSNSIHKAVELNHFYSFFYSKEILQVFSGSLFSLRAPPNFIA